MADDVISRAGLPAETIATDAQPAPASPDAPERMHGKDGQISDALNRPQSPSPLEDHLQKEHDDLVRWRNGSDFTVPPERIEGARTSNPEKDAIACLDCEEAAEFVTFSDPPLAKCFRCAILRAMERWCALCGRHVVECIVRAVGENERKDVIGICSSCFSKRLSGMVN